MELELELTTLLGTNCRNAPCGDSNLGSGRKVKDASDDDGYDLRICDRISRTLHSYCHNLETEPIQGR